MLGCIHTEFKGLPVRSIICFIAIAVYILSGYTAMAITEDRDDEAQRHFQAAQRAQAAGSYSLAAEEYQKVIAILPQAAEAYASLGLAYNAESKFAESATALEKAEHLKPGLPGVALYLGIDLVKTNHPEAAVKRLREALRLEPANQQALLWLSTALSGAGQATEALTELVKASRLFPSDPVILLRLGEAYRRAADARMEQVILAASGQPLAHQVYGDIYKDEQLWQKANGHYRRAIAEDAHWAGAHLGLAEVALQQGKLEEAEKEFRQEALMNPSSAGADAGLAEIALLRGKPEDALALLDAGIPIASAETSFALGLPPATATNDAKADEDTLERLRLCLPSLQSAPPSPSRSLALAFVSWRLGDTKAFRSAWKEFENSASHPTVANSYEGGTDNFYRQKLDLAEAALESWLKANPSDLQASYLLARTYRGLSLIPFQQLLYLAPDSYPAHQLLAETYANAENDDQAIAEYRIVDRMAPNLPGIHFAIGHLLLRHGNSDEAMAEFQAELRLNPDHAAASAEIGAILVGEEEQRAGIIYLKKATQLAPDLWAAHRELGEAYYREKNLVLAEAELQQAIGHDPEGLAAYQLGLVYRALGRSEAAKTMFERSRQIKADRFSEGIETQVNPEAPRP
jgi:tetratricopeptide (TPR) repeat protein